VRERTPLLSGNCPQQKCTKYREKARKEAGYPWLQVKDLRRAYAIKLAKSGGVEMQHLQRAPGHNSVQMTGRYYAPYSNDLSIKRVLKVLEEGKKSGLRKPPPQAKTGQKQETRLFAPIDQSLETLINNGGADETRTRDLRRDRPQTAPYQNLPSR